MFVWTSAGVHVNAAAVVKFPFSRDDHASFVFDSLQKQDVLRLVELPYAPQMQYSSPLQHFSFRRRRFSVVVPSVGNAALTPPPASSLSYRGRKRLLQSGTYPLCNVATVYRPGRTW